MAPEARPRPCQCVVKEAMELQVEACMKEEDEEAAASFSDTSVEENPDRRMTGLVPSHRHLWKGARATSTRQML